MGKPAPIEGLEKETALAAAAQRSIAARLDDVRAYATRLEGPDCDADDLHDLRVASRRLRAALQLFERKRQLAEAHDAVRALGDALGEVRELHVQLAWLDEAAARASEPERAGMLALRQERASKLPRRLERVRKALDRWTGGGAAEVEAAAAALELSGSLGGDRVRKRVSRRMKSVRRRLATTEKSNDPHTAHRLRIGVKKLRYVAELTQPAFPSEMQALLDHMEPLQETLGELHDADVHIPLIEKFLVRADATTQPGALALLRAEMARRELQATALAEAQAKFRQERILEELRDALC